METRSSMGSDGAGLVSVVTVTPPNRCSPARAHPSSSRRCAPRIDTSKARAKRESSPRPSRSKVARPGPSSLRPTGSAHHGATTTRSSLLAAPSTNARAACQSDEGATERTCTACAASSTRPTTGTTAKAHFDASLAEPGLTARAAYTSPWTSSRLALRGEVRGGLPTMPLPKLSWPRPGTLAFVAVAVLATAPAWIVEHPPLQDLPFHIATLRLIHDHGNPAYGFADVYQLTLLRTEYLLYYLLGDAFAFAVGVKPPSAPLVCLYLP